MGTTLNQQDLDKLNVAQDTKGNFKNLEDMGGLKYLFKTLNLDPEKGLSSDQIEGLRRQFGTNAFPESISKTFMELFIGAFNDTTLMILLAAAMASFIIGLATEPDGGWIEGVAIFIAVFLVAILTAGNDYSKELQFRALEASAQKDERASVLRNGHIVRINPSEIVVGDIIFLQAGDSIPADAIVVDASKLLVNESALTGEPEDVKKRRDKDPFLISSCLVTECEETHAVVTGIGPFSQWGKIKANLTAEAVNTPLQDKLEDMTELIGYIGMGAAVCTFMALFIRILVDNSNYLNGIMNAVILSVTIIVVAIPEGLPLAVTIALAYSTKKMYQDQCFIRVLAACETMGNATNICSDKTGTLTENRMTVVEGFFADCIFNDVEFRTADDELSQEAQQIIIENSCINRVAYIMDTDKDGNELDRPAIIGNKTEGALMMMSRAWGTNEETCKKELFSEEKGDKIFAFNSSKKRSSAIVFRKDGSVCLCGRDIF